MRLLSTFRTSYLEDKTFGFILLSCLFIPLLIIPPLSDPIELVKFSFWLILVALSIFYSTRSRAGRIVLSKPFLFCLLVLFAWSVLSTIWSIDIINSIFGNSLKYTSSILFLGLWAVWLLLLGLQDKLRFLLLLKALIISGTLVALWGVVQSFGIGFYPGLTTETRTLFPSFLGNPNYSAMFLVPVIFLIPWGYKQAEERIEKLLYITSFIISIWGLIIFSSRGAMIALLGGGLLFVIISAVKKQWKVVASGLLVVLIFFLLASTYITAVRIETPTDLASGADQSALERFSIWSQSIDMIDASPLVGSGPGNFFLMSRQYNNSALPGPTWFDDAHNIFLQVGVSMGYPALIALLGLIFIALSNLLKSFLDKTEDHFLPTLLLCGMLGWLFAASFNPVTLPNWLIFGVLLVALFQVYPRETPYNISKKIKVPIIATSCIIVMIGTAMLLSDVMIWQSYRQQSAHPEFSHKLMRWSLLTNPININSLFNLLSYHLGRGEYREVEYYMEYLNTMHPHSAGIRQKAFFAYYLMYKRTGSAEYKAKLSMAANQYILTSPYNVKTYQDIAYAFLLAGELKQSEYYARKAIIVKGHDPYLWILLTKIYIEQNDYKNAIWAYEKAYELLPNSQYRIYIKDAKENKKEGKDIILPTVFPEIMI